MLRLKKQTNKKESNKIDPHAECKQNTQTLQNLKSQCNNGFLVSSRERQEVELTNTCEWRTFQLIVGFRL